MAWLRERHRKDGSVYFQVAWRLADGSITSDSYTSRAEAERTRKLVEAVGGDQALEILGISRSDRARPGDITLTEWLHEYVDHYLPGRDEGTLAKYRAYIRNDIDPVLGTKRLADLDRKDLSLWLQFKCTLLAEWAERQVFSLNTERTQDLAPLADLLQHSTTPQHTRRQPTHLLPAN